MLRKASAVIAASALAAAPALAHCPLCAAATAGGVGAARLLGVDDTVVGTFIGGFAVSTGLWFSNWLTKKRQGAAIPLQQAISVIASVALTILTLYLARLLGSADPSFLMFGIDKILVGTLAGTIVTLAAFALHKWIRKVRGGKSLMPFQGIALTLACLSVTGAVFFFAT